MWAQNRTFGMALADCPTGGTCFFFFQYADADYIPMSPFIFWTFSFFTTEILCVIKRHSTDNFLRSPSSREIFFFHFSNEFFGYDFFKSVIFHLPSYSAWEKEEKITNERKRRPGWWTCQILIAQPIFHHFYDGRCELFVTSESITSPIWCMVRIIWWIVKNIPMEIRLFSSAGYHI